MYTIIYIIINLVYLLYNIFIKVDGINVDVNVEVNVYFIKMLIFNISLHFRL